MQQTLRAGHAKQEIGIRARAAIIPGCRAGLRMRFGLFGYMSRELYFGVFQVAAGCDMDGWMDGWNACMG